MEAGVPFVSNLPGPQEADEGDDQLKNRHRVEVPDGIRTILQPDPRHSTCYLISLALTSSGGAAGLNSLRLGRLLPTTHKSLDQPIRQGGCCSPLRSFCLDLCLYGEPCKSRSTSEPGNEAPPSQACFV